MTVPPIWQVDAHPTYDHVVYVAGYPFIDNGRLYFRNTELASHPDAELVAGFRRWVAFGLIEGLSAKDVDYGSAIDEPKTETAE